MNEFIKYSRWRAKCIPPMPLKSSKTVSSAIVEGIVVETSAVKTKTICDVTIMLA